MASSSSFKVPMRKIVLDGREEMVSSVGLGLMSLSMPYGFETEPSPETEQRALDVIGKALEMGVNLVNSSVFYGPGHNEKLLGKAITKFGRDKFFITDKCGKAGFGGAKMSFDCTPEIIAQQCDESLKRLGTDYIDVYIPARLDPNTNIEDVVRALAALQSSGKIRHIGLSEVNAPTLRRAAAVAKISFLEIEYSLWMTEIEHAVLPACRELGIKVLAYSPLGRGFLTGATPKFEEMDAHDFRKLTPRFHPDNAAHNRAAFVVPLEKIAARLSEETGATVKPGQVALAWVMSRGEDIFPIPGTKRVHLVEENFRTAALKLSATDLEELDAIAKEVAKGHRYPEMAQDILQDLKASA